MRWNGEELWVWSAEPAHEAIIPRETFDAAQGRMASRSGGRGPRTAPKRNRHYVLRGRLRCALCQRNLQGALSNGRTLYRCKFGVEYAAAALRHPKSVNLREDQLLPHVDEWLATIFGDEHLDETCEALASAADLEAVVDTSADEATLRDCDTKLARYRAALDAGTDVAVVASWIKQVTADRNAAAARIAAARQSATVVVTADEIRTELDRLGGLLPLLQMSDPKLKARFYEEVGLTGVYDPRARVVDVEVRVLNDRVGGGTSTIIPRHPIGGWLGSAA
jgi:site-specific DNA recombinase